VEACTTAVAAATEVAGEEGTELRDRDPGCEII